MKRNAINRIIIWCLVLVILLGLLLLGLCWNGGLFGVTVIEATEAYDIGSSRSSAATVIKDSWLLNSPSPDSQQKSRLSSGTTVHVTRLELVNGSQWAYVDSPDSGWIAAESLRLEDSGSGDSSARIDGAAQFSADIQEIEIDWVSGNIRLVPANVSGIEVSESSVDDSKYAMICKQDGGTLKIEYCKNTTFADLKNLKLSKDLTILVPIDWSGRALKVDAASSKLYVEDLNIRDVEVDTASGTSQFHNCTVDELDIDTASGDIRFTGSLNRLECDSASASVYAELNNVPSEIDMDTASGAVELILPKDAGFSVKLDSMSGSFDSDFPTTMKNGQYVCGNGACRIDMSSMSGKVTIRAGS